VAACSDRQDHNVINMKPLRAPPPAASPSFSSFKMTVEADNKTYQGWTTVSWTARVTLTLTAAFETDSDSDSYLLAS